MRNQSERVPLTWDGSFCVLVEDRAEKMLNPG